MIDIIIQWKIFLGRVDVRAMQPALQEKEKDKKSADINNAEDATTELAETYRGCVFNYSTDMVDDDDDFWFDFMADCGKSFIMKR